MTVALLLTVLNVLAACAKPALPQPPPPTAPTTPSPAANPRPTASLAPTSGAPRRQVTPLVTSARIFPHSWSPDGKTLAYWTFTPEEAAADYTYPPGTLQFLDIRTGQPCPSPYKIGYGYFCNSIGWLPDKRVFAFPEGEALAGIPCDKEFSKISLFTVPIAGIDSYAPDRSMFLLSSQEGYWLYEPGSQAVRKVDQSVSGTRAGYSWSPGRRRLAVTAAFNTQDLIAATYIVDTRTGRVEDAIKWKYREAEGNFGGPIWLSEDQFLIQETVDQGPLLVTIGKETIPIVPKWFGQPVQAQCKQDLCSLQATAAVVTDTSTYHVALYGVGDESDFPLIQLYHSESGKVEELPFRSLGGFSSDGQSLLLYRSMADTTMGESYQLWMRLVDPPNAEARLLLTQVGASFFPIWSPDGSKLAISSPEGTRVLSPDGTEVGLWETGNGSLPGSWSPDGKLLAVRGYLPGGSETLSIISVP